MGLQQGVLRGDRHLRGESAGTFGKHPCTTLLKSVSYPRTRVVVVVVVLNIQRSGVLTALTRLVPHEIVAFSARSVYTIQPGTTSHHAKPHT